MTKTKGYVIYEGKSLINGDDIVAIVTMSSSNVKTGDMPSMWILHKELSPTQASKEGKDEAVCGDCKLRHFSAGACYVTLFQAPLAVWKSYHRGLYPNLTDYSVFEGVRMRFGAYGDPYAIPLDILTKIKAVVANNTSYTHQWRKDKGLQSTTMASADTIGEAMEAQAEGWRTFRVTNRPDFLLENEIICPNYTSGVQCIDCKLCSGTSSKGKSIVIPVHGAKKGKFEETLT